LTIRSAVSIQYTNVTNGQTDRRRDRQTPAKNRIRYVFVVTEGVQIHVRSLAIGNVQIDLLHREAWLRLYRLAAPARHRPTIDDHKGVTRIALRL